MGKYEDQAAAGRQRRAAEYGPMVALWDSVLATYALLPTTRPDGRPIDTVQNLSRAMDAAVVPIGRMRDQLRFDAQEEARLAAGEQGKAPPC